MMRLRRECPHRREIAPVPCAPATAIRLRPMPELEAAGMLCRWAKAARAGAREGGERPTGLRARRRLGPGAPAPHKLKP